MRTTFAIATSLALLAFAGCKKEAAPTAPAPATKTLAAGHEGHRHEPSDPFACRMHPEETGLTADATCPVCKMKLEPRKK